MATVHKFELRTDKPTELELPASAKVIKFALQNTAKANAFHIWVELPLGKHKLSKRTYRIYPTGAEVKKGSKHVGSHMLNDDYHIFHCYES